MTKLIREKIGESGLGDHYRKNPDYQGRISFKHGDRLLVGKYDVFKVGTVVSYALESGNDPIACYLETVERGQKTHWLNPEASCIHNGPRSTEVIYDLSRSMGDVGTIWIEGKAFTLKYAPNRNIDLVAV